MEASHAITLMSNNARFEIKEVGVFTPKMLAQEKLNPGDVGFFIANIKSTADMKIGDTITDQRHPSREALPGFQEIHPMVFSGIYPINTARLRTFEDGNRKAASERCRVHLSTGEFRCARIRISLRISGIAAHGDHPGTAPARV